MPQVLDSDAKRRWFRAVWWAGSKMHSRSHAAEVDVELEVVLVDFSLVEENVQLPAGEFWGPARFSSYLCRPGFM